MGVRVPVREHDEPPGAGQAKAAGAPLAGPGSVSTGRGCLLGVTSQDNHGPATVPLMFSPSPDGFSSGPRVGVWDEHENVEGRHVFFSCSAGCRLFGSPISSPLDSPPDSSQ